LTTGVAKGPGELWLKEGEIVLATGTAEKEILSDTLVEDETLWLAE